MELHNQPVFIVIYILEKREISNKGIDMYKKLAMIMLLCFCTIQSVQASNEFGITFEIYKDICGVWDLYPDLCHGYETLSWGPSRLSPNVSVIIDLGEIKPVFVVGGMGESQIKQVFRSNNNIVIRFLDWDNNKEQNIEFTIINNDKIVFKDMDWFKGSILKKLFNQNNYYHKVGGPIIKYYKPNVNNLRIRNDASAKSTILNMLSKSDKLIILKKGKEERIGEVKGRWVRVLTEKNDIGWCFDSYLETY